MGLLALALALVSVCPVGGRLATPNGSLAPQAPLTSAGAIAPHNIALHNVTASLCSANSDPAGAHPQGMLCLDAPQMSLAEGLLGLHRSTISLVGCSTALRLHRSSHTAHQREVWGDGLLGGQEPLQHQHCFAWCGACQVGLVPDSGLDASSQYPSLGSFTTPAARLMVETRGVPQGFLSYYHVMPSSRPSQERCLPGT